MDACWGSARLSRQTPRHNSVTSQISTQFNFRLEFLKLPSSYITASVLDLGLACTLPPTRLVSLCSRLYTRGMRSERPSQRPPGLAQEDASLPTHSFALCGGMGLGNSALLGAKSIDCNPLIINTSSGGFGSCLRRNFSPIN